jgi:hypothetical protein
VTIYRSVASPATRNITELVLLLARMARFIITGTTDASGIFPHAPDVARFRLQCCPRPERPSHGAPDQPFTCGVSQMASTFGPSRGQISSVDESWRWLALACANFARRIGLILARWQLWRASFLVSWSL